MRSSHSHFSRPEYSEEKESGFFFEADDLTALTGSQVRGTALSALLQRNVVLQPVGHLAS
jgi:hypothetical protein